MQNRFTSRASFLHLELEKLAIMKFGMRKNCVAVEYPELHR